MPGRSAPRRDIIAANRRKAEAISHAGRYIAPALLVVALVLPFIAQRSYLDLGVVVLTYILLGWGLNIVVGLAGLLDLGYVAFYAVGAYTYAIFSTTYGLGFWTCLPLAGLFAAIAGVALGFPVLRLRGDYLAIVTLGFGEIIRIVINNWSSLTNGPNGILDIPRPTLFGLTFTNSGKRHHLRRFLPPRPQPDLPGGVSVLRGARPGFADQLGHVAPAPPAARPRLGSLA